MKILTLSGLLHARFTPRPMTRYSQPWHWPNGEKIAISIGLAFEAFESHSQLTSAVAGSKKDQPLLAAAAGSAAKSTPAAARSG